MNKLPNFNTHIPPAQLWLGNHDLLVEQTKQWLQQQYCPARGCTTCSQCRAIADEQHHAITWIYPIKNSYTLEQIAIIASTISFSLEQEKKHFFIIAHADMLSATCANSLLKSLEEPPAGYHFILLAQRKEAFLPTIISRCIAHTFAASTSTSKNSPLFIQFSTLEKQNPQHFLKMLEQEKITEQESLEIIDQLLAHWIDVQKQSIIQHDIKRYEHAQHIIKVLKQALKTPLMPGSSNLMWKNIFLQLQR